MPGGADPFRAQFLLQVRAEGEGEVDRLNQALAQARARAAEIRQEFISGVTDAAAYKTAITAAAGQIGFLEKKLGEVVVPLEALSAQATATAGQFAEAMKKIVGAAYEAAQAEETEAEKAIAATAKKAAADEKATQKRIADAQKAAEEVRRASDQVNAALDREASATEAARQREAVATDKATAAETADLVRAAETHAEFLMREDALEAQVEARRNQRRQNAVANNIANVQAQVDAQQLLALQAMAGAQQNFNQIINVGAAYATKANQAYIGTGLAMDQSKSGIERASYALLNFSHAVQDAQFGVGAILNNIPLVTTSFISAVPALDKLAAKVGGPAGIAGALMITAVAADTLYHNWDKVEKFFGERGVGTLTPVVDSSKHLAHELAQASTQLEKLSDKARLSLPELEKFRELQAKITDIEAKQSAQRDEEALRGIKGTKEAEAADAFKKGVAEAGGGAQAQADLVQSLVNLGDQTGQQYTIQGITQQANQLMRDAAEGNLAARDQIVNVVNRFMPEGQRGLAAEIGKASPERKKMIEGIDKANKEEEDNIEEAQRQAREAAQDHAKDIREGVAEAAAGDKDVAAKDKAIRDAAKAQARAEAKAVRAAPGLARKAARAGVLGQRGEIAGKLEERFGGFEGGVSPQQAGEGAEKFQQLIGQGQNPVLAQTQVNQLMTQFIQQNLAGQAQMGQMNAQMMATLQQAIQMQAMFQAQLEMAGVRNGKNAVRRAMPMPVIPF